MRKYILLIQLIVVLPFCTANKIHSEKSEVLSNIDDNVNKYFNGSYKTVFNNDSTFCFCISVLKEENKAYNSFIIYDVNNMEMIFQDSKPACKVKWINNEEISVAWDPEIINGKEDESFSYVYNISIKKKRTSDQMIVE